MAKDAIKIPMREILKGIRIPTAKGSIVFPDKKKYNRRKKHKQTDPGDA